MISGGFYENTKCLSPHYSLFIEGGSPFGAPSVSYADTSPALRGRRYRRRCATALAAFGGGAAKRSRRCCASTFAAGAANIVRSSDVVSIITPCGLGYVVRRPCAFGEGALLVLNRACSIEDNPAGASPGPRKLFLRKKV